METRVKLHAFKKKKKKSLIDSLELFFESYVREFEGNINLVDFDNYKKIKTRLRQGFKMKNGS